MSDSLYTDAGVAGTADARTPGSGRRRTAPPAPPSPASASSVGAEAARRGRAVDHAPGGHARPREDQRHREGALVEEDAVLLLAVLPEHLAVVADGGHDPPAGIPTRKAAEEASDLPVDVGDLAGVPAGGGRALSSRPAAGTARADRSSAPRGSTGGRVGASPTRRARRS